MSYYLSKIQGFKGFLSGAIFLPEFLETKAHLIGATMSEKNLGESFIGNIHQFSSCELQQYQASGLVHLLAISGGQIHPVNQFIGFILTYFTFFTLKKTYSFNHMMKINSVIKLISGIIVSFGLSFLYGGTGALLRTASLDFLKRIPIFSILRLRYFKFTRFLNEHTLDNALILIIFCLLFGPFGQNYSFLLSAIGACCAGLSARTVKALLTWCHKTPCHKIKKLRKITNMNIFYSTCSTIATSIFIGILFYAVNKTSFLNSCLANIVAIPLVTFLVTPLSIIALLLPLQSKLMEVNTYFLNMFLRWFHNLSLIFSDIPFGCEDIPRTTSALFSSWGLIYINILFVILFALYDLVKTNKLQNIKSSLQKAKARRA